MTTEMWIIAAVRVAGSLPVLRWPLAGAFIAIFVDLSDLFLRDWIDLGGVKDYQRFDKSLDQVYMATFLLVALRWQATPRNIAVALYAFRLVGSIAFELTGDRAVLILFPNAFEYWFIFVAALKHHNLVGSMGRVGACGDNAAMESFFSLLQKNVLDRQRWSNREELRVAIVIWIERTYHRRRRQRGLGRLTPIEYETLNTAAHAA